MTGSSLEDLVEEPSAERALQHLLPRIVPGLPFEVRPFRGKPDLLKKLPSRLAGYAHFPRGYEPLVVVLLDRDDDDCVELKKQVSAIAEKVGLSVIGPTPTVLVRIAVEELEAWFFGDVPAVAVAYPRAPVSLADRRGFRDPDAVVGGTAEALERVLRKHGYHGAGLSKTAAASDIAVHMDVDANRSRSFQVFRDGLRALAGTGGS